jgi:hypothetical protein
MRSIVTYLGVLMVVALLGAGCSGDEADDTTTTTVVPSTTAAGSAGTIAPGAGSDGTTTTTAVVDEDAPFSIPAYEVVDRIDGENGATVVVLLDPATYTALTDVDLQNVIEDVIDRFPPVYEVHVVDDITAADLVLADAVPPAQQEILDEHYLVRLEEGFTIVYVGPFSNFPVTIIAS